MTTHELERSQRLDWPLPHVFGFFSDAANLEAITPPFLRFRILSPLPIDMREGAQIEYALSLYGVPVRWKTVITSWRPNVSFIDQQASGPFALWHHTHTFEAVDGGVIMRDRVLYREPFGPIGQLAHGLFTRSLVERIFDHRAEVIPACLAAKSATTAMAEPTAAGRSKGAWTQPERADLAGPSAPSADRP